MVKNVRVTLERKATFRMYVPILSAALACIAGSYYLSNEIIAVILVSVAIGSLYWASQIRCPRCKNSLILFAARSPSIPQKCPNCNYDLEENPHNYEA